MEEEHEHGELGCKPLGARSIPIGSRMHGKLCAVLWFGRSHRESDHGKASFVSPIVQALGCLYLSHWDLLLGFQLNLGHSLHGLKHWQ